MRKGTCIITLLSMLWAIPGSAFDAAGIKSYVTDPANKDSITRVEGRTGRRWARIAGGIAIGAVAGAAHAALTGRDIGQDALIGAAAGGAIAFAVTKYQERRLRTRDQVASDIGYTSENGVVAQVDVEEVQPVATGGQLSLSIKYLAIAPDSRQAIQLSRYAAIMTESGRPLRGFAFAPDPFAMPDGGGQYLTTMDIDLNGPDGNPIDPGTYVFAWVVDGQVQAIGSRAFTVNG